MFLNFWFVEIGRKLHLLRLKNANSFNLRSMAACECPILPLAMDHANLENGVGARPIIISRLPNRLVPETFDTACL